MSTPSFLSSSFCGCFSVADGVRIRACAFSSLSRAALTTLPGISSSHSQSKTSLTHTHTHSLHSGSETYWLMVGRNREMQLRRFKVTMLVHLLGMRINTESMEIMNVNSGLETAVKWAAIREHPVKPAATWILLHVCLWYYGTETRSGQKADGDLYFSGY